MFLHDFRNMQKYSEEEENDRFVSCTSTVLTGDGFHRNLQDILLGFQHYCILTLSEADYDARAVICFSTCTGM